MFKKLQDQFTKDLLDAVSGVLKSSPEQIQEKAVNKHGHDHPGREDHDVNNDGATDSTDSYLKNRRKAIAKTMSMKKEDTEQVDEMSSKMKMKLGLYGKKKKVAEEAEQIDETAKIVAHLQKRYGDNIRKSHVRSAANDFGVDASKLAKAVRTKLGKNMLDEEDDGWYTHSEMHGSKKSEKHPKGISAAEWKSGIRWHHGKNKRINIKEEVEQVDELSIGTMKSYGDKRARTAFSGGRKPGQSVDAGIAQKSRQSNSLSLARTKINRARDTGSTVLNKEEVVTEAPVDGVAAGSMEGDKHLCATKVLHKEWAEGTPIFSQHAEPDFLGNIAWYDVMFEHGIERQVPTSDMEILMAESHMHSKKKMKEEVEELDEISAEMKGRYKKAASRDVDRAQDFKSELDHEGEPEGSRVRKDVDRIIKNRETGMKRANEDVELDEARGRPRKAGAKDFTIHPKTKEKLMHNNPEHMKTIGLLQKNKILEKPKVEAGQHIINQLQKAKLSMRGGETIHFTHGESNHVSGVHAAKLLTKYAGMRPSDKETFQKKIGHSHENLKSEL